VYLSPALKGSPWNWVWSQGSEETRVMVPPDGRKCFKIGLAVCKTLRLSVFNKELQYQRVTDRTQPPSQPRWVCQHQLSFLLLSEKMSSKSFHNLSSYVAHTLSRARAHTLIRPIALSRALSKVNISSSCLSCNRAVKQRFRPTCTWSNRWFQKIVRCWNQVSLRSAGRHASCYNITQYSFLNK